MKTCPKCQTENRDNARFCMSCRAPIAPPVVGQPAATVLAMPPALGQQATLRARLSNRAAHKNWSFWHGRMAVEGRVTAVDPARDLPMPFDFGRLLVLISAGLVGLGLFLMIATAALVIAIVLLVLGIGGLCVMPLLLPVLGAALYPIYKGLRGRQIAPMVEMRVDDAWSGQPVSVILFLGYGSSNVRLGDQVRVFGAKMFRSHAIRATHIDIVETNGQPAQYGVDGLRPWPVWVGIAALMATLVLYGWLLTNGSFSF